MKISLSLAVVMNLTAWLIILLAIAEAGSIRQVSLGVEWLITLIVSFYVVVYICLNDYLDHVDRLTGFRRYIDLLILLLSGGYLYLLFFWKRMLGRTNE